MRRAWRARQRPCLASAQRLVPGLVVDEPEVLVLLSSESGGVRVDDDDEDEPGSLVDGEPLLLVVPGYELLGVLVELLPEPEDG